MKDETKTINFNAYINQRLQVPIESKTPWQGKRNKFITNRVLSALREVIRTELGIETNLSWVSPPAKLSEVAVTIAKVELRAYQHSMFLFVPAEFLCDLASSIRGELLHPICHLPGEQELATMGYAIARILSAPGMFVHHRVVLSGIQILNTQSEREDEDKVFCKTSSSDQWQHLAVEVEAFGTFFLLQLMLARKLYERVNHYARLFLDCSAHSSLLARARVSSSVHLVIRCNNFLNLLTARNELISLSGHDAMSAVLVAEDSKHILPLQVASSDDNYLYLRGDAK